MTTTTTARFEVGAEYSARSLIDAAPSLAPTSAATRANSPICTA